MTAAGDRSDHPVRTLTARTRRWEDPASAQGRAVADPGRPAPHRRPPSARGLRAGVDPPLREPEPAQLRRRHGLLSARLVHHEIQPKVNEWAARLAGFADLHPSCPTSWRRDAGAPVGARAGPGRDRRDACRHASAGRRSAGELTASSWSARTTAAAAIWIGPKFWCRLGPRHEPRHGLDGRLQDGLDPLRAGRGSGPRRFPCGARSRTAAVMITNLRRSACSSRASANCWKRFTPSALLPTWTGRT